MQYARIHKLFDKACITKGVPDLLNEGSPYGATVAMATYMIQITLFHKKSVCLGLFYKIKVVRNKYQNMPNISNLYGF